MEFLSELRKAGFNLSLNNENNIVVFPVSKLTQQQREFIITNKPEIVRELELEKAYLHWHIVTKTEDVKFAVIPPSSLTEIKAQFPKAIIVEPVETLQ